MTGKTLSLQQIFCQDKAVGSLQRAFGAGKMAHAYIFAGSTGDDGKRLGQNAALTEPG
jgi:hypothetical protein